MTMTFLQQMAVLPALLVTLAGLLALHGPDEEKGKQRFLLFLLAAGVLLLTAVFLTNQPPDAPYNPLSFQLPTLLTPAILGILALILLNLKTVCTFNRREKIIAGLLGLAMLALFGLLWNPRLGLAFLILPGTLALLVGWTLGRQYRWLPITLCLMFLVTLFYFNWFMSHPPDYTTATPSPVLNILLLAIFYIIPGMAVVMAAVLIAASVQPLDTHGENPAPTRPRLLLMSLAFIVLIYLAYTIFWGSVWDQTDDGLAGIFILQSAGIVAVGVGMVMMVALRGKNRLAGLLFMLVVPLLLYQSFGFGWRVSYHEMTEKRAARIAGALDQFQEREGSYPETLAALTPRDLLFIQQPIILAGETWCYQGSTDFYRLAAFHREFFSSPVSLRIYEAAGEPPPGSWTCEEQVTVMKERYYSPMEDPAAMRPPMPTPLPEIEVGMSKTVVQPVLGGVPVAAGSWSPDSAYFVFGARTADLGLHFLDRQTDEVCPVEGDLIFVETLRGRHTWLSDGRLLYLDAAGEMVIITPCQPEVEYLTGRFPEMFTQIRAYAAGNGRILLQSEGAYWILDGRTLNAQLIPDVTPNPYELHWDQFAWLPGGEQLVISRLEGRSGSNEGSTLYLIDGDSGQVVQNLPLTHDFGQSAPWIEGLSEDEILMHGSGDWLIVDFSADPPQFTNVLADIFNIEVDFSGEISASGSFVDKDGNGYYLGVRLNHARNQDTYLYHSKTRRVHLYDHEHHTLLLFPDGELWEMAKQNGPSFRDEYDLVLAAQPEVVQPRLILSGHTPREYPHLSIKYLSATSQLAVASAHGVSLVSWPDGEMVTYWDLAEEGFSPWVIVSPDGASFVAVQDFGGLYGPLP